MKQHTKKDREYFVNEVNEILKAKASFVEDVKDYEGNHWYKSFKVDCRGTTLQIKLFPAKEHKHVFSVYTKFDKPTKIGNRFTGKHNFHETYQPDICHTLDDVVDSFEDFLNDAIGLKDGDVCAHRLSQPNY